MLLRLLEGLVVVEEVRAGILHAAVEEERVKVVPEVVMVRDVALGLADRVRLLEALEGPRDALEHALERVGGERRAVHREQGDEVAQGRAVLEAHGAVHIGLARMELRVEDELAVEARIGEPHRDLRAGRAGEDMRAALRVDHPEGAGAHEGLHHVRQGEHLWRPRGLLQAPC